MSSELVYRKPCEHGSMRRHTVDWPLPVATNANDFMAKWCPGGVEQVLDPDKVLVGIFTEADSLQETYYLKADVADVLAVLDGEDT